MKKKVKVLKSAWVIIEEGIENYNSYLREGSDASIKMGGLLTIESIREKVVARYEAPKTSRGGGAECPTGALISLSSEDFEACCGVKDIVLFQDKSLVVSSKKNTGVSLLVNTAEIGVISLILWIIGVPLFIAIGVATATVILLKLLVRKTGNNSLLIQEAVGSKKLDAQARALAYEELRLAGTLSEEDVEKFREEDKRKFLR